MIQLSNASGNAVQVVLHRGLQINAFPPSPPAGIGGVPPSVDIPCPCPGDDELEGRDAIVRSLLGRAYGGRDRAGACEVLCGLGGVGKTALARELARRMRDRGTRVWWIPAGNGARMVDAFRAVAVRAGADPANLLSVNPADVLWDALRGSTDPWAIFVDALDDTSCAIPPAPAVTRSSDPAGAGAAWIRPPPPGGFLCVSSRDCRPERWGSWVTINKIDCLDPVSGGRVLLRHSPCSGDRESAERLSRSLGGLPLALGIVGRFLHRQATDPFPVPPGPVTFAAYAELLQERLEGIAPDPDDPADPGTVLRATWEISVERLHDDGLVLAGEILRFLAVLADAPIVHVPLLEALRRCRREGPGAGNWTARRISDTLRGLHGASLVELHGKPGENLQEPLDLRIGLHPVVRAVTRADLRQSEGWYPMLGTAVTVLRDVLDGMPREPLDDWGTWEPLCEHALCLMHAADPGAMDRETFLEAVDLGHRAAWARYVVGHYAQAEEDFRAVLHRLSEHDPQDPRRTVRTSSCLGRAVREAGRAGEAADLLRTTVERSTRELGERDQNTLDARVNLGRTLREMGENDAAETMFTQVLDIASETLGEEHEITVVARLNRARCLRDRGAHTEAVPEYRRGLDTWTRSRPGTSLMTLDIRYEMAENLRLAGDLERAEQEYVPLRSEAIEFLGRSHPNTSVIRRGWAMLLETRGRSPQAREELQDVLTARMETLGERHPQVQETLRDLRRVRGSSRYAP